MVVIFKAKLTADNFSCCVKFLHQIIQFNLPSVRYLDTVATLAS